MDIYNGKLISVNDKDIVNGVLDIPEGILYVDSNFLDRVKQNIERINFPSSIRSLVILSDKLINKPSYISFTDNDYLPVITFSPISGSIPFRDFKLDLEDVRKFLPLNKNLLNEQRNKDIRYFYKSFLFNNIELSQEQIENFLKSHNFTFFKQLVKKLNIENPSAQSFGTLIKNVYKCFYNLGVFSTPINKNGKTINYSQIVSEYLLSRLDKSGLISARDLDITARNLGRLFASANTDGLKPEFTDFFISNFDELYFGTLDRKFPCGIDFIANCYNYFNEIQKTNTSDRGSQRQLKPTVKKFVDYFETNAFEGITEETREIADTIKPYFSKQQSFDHAVNIHNEQITNQIPNNILSSHLSEKDVFKNIDDIAKVIQKLQAQTLKNMTDIAENEFTFDWLEKNDPQNFILGKLCSCCSHLEGAGYGIMHASMAHPNVQSLIIRNEKGEIVAKSTLYVNKKEGYGVCNNVEVNTNISTQQSRSKIYQKFILGITEFAERYNKEHKDKPLKQINVGMSHNDLISEIETNNLESQELLKAIDYSKFGISTHCYNGDSSGRQYIVWSNKHIMELMMKQLSSENEKDI